MALKRGDTGADVAELQRQLGIKDDGIFGPETEAAVRSHQEKNGLSVDGIVGPETQGSLSGGNNTNPTSENASSEFPSGDVTVGVGPGETDRGEAKGPGGGEARWADEATTVTSEPPTTKKTKVPFSTSEETEQRKREKEGIEGSKPDPYSSKYSGQIDEILETILGDKGFNAETDPTYAALYDKYKAEYTALGQKAMKDAIGTSAGLTGGYANSWGQSAGQQAYNDYMMMLNDKSIDLMDFARSIYNDNSQRNKDLLSIYLGLDDRDYGRYSDDYNRWLEERGYAAGEYDDSFNRDLEVYDRGRQEEEDTSADYEHAYNSAYALAQSGVRVPKMYADILSQEDIDTLNGIADSVNAGVASAGGASTGTSTGKQEKEPEENPKNDAPEYELYDKSGRLVGAYTEDVLEEMVKNGEVIKTVDKNGNITYTYGF